MRIRLIVFLLTVLGTLGFQEDTKACHAIALVNITQQNVSGTQIQVTAASDSPTCGCDVYWLDVEVRCLNEPFDGAPFSPGFHGPLSTYPYFQSAQMNKNSCVVQNYPWVTIPFANLCPGMTYQYRMRENHNGAVGPWCATQTFTVPGATAPIVAGINATTTNICSGQCATLDATVVSGCGLAAGYTWSTGATTQQITVCPTVTTTYTVTIDEQCSGFQDNASVTINVTPPPVAGTAAIAPATVCAGDPTNLTLTGSAGIIQWQSAPNAGGPWTNIGGATNATLTQNPTANTCYRAEVTGCTGAVFSNVVCVTVDPPPVPNFNMSPACQGQATNFTDASTTGGGTAITGWAWDFGDGNTSTAQNPSHTYGGFGPYTVTLTVTNATGCSATLTQNYTPAPNPTANFNANPACPGAATTFTDASAVGGGGVITNWAWDFGDGNTSTAQNPSNTYATAGTYNVTLTVTTADGCTSTIVLPITVPTNPVANFTTANVCDGVAATFTDMSTGANTWNWDFGDGNTSTAQNPTHTYAGPGTYNVTLVASAGTCTDQIILPITIHPSPVANFNATPGCAGAATNFTDMSTNATGWAWDFGDGNTSTAQNPSNTYAAGGTYNVQLTVTSANGCTHVVTIPVVVPENPVADFTFNAGCPGTPTTFTDASTVGGASTINTWAWDFGDGNTSTAQNPSNSYAASGNYNVQLTVTTNDGCTHSVTIPVTVPASTTADFTGTNVCEGFAANFTDLSTGATAWAWDFGDGNTSTAQNPSHTYAAAGTYNVTLVASAGICTDNVTYPITIYPSPVANFNATPDCEGSATTFADASTGATSWSWDFGDGNTSTAQNPSNTYTTGGTYNVQLAVMSADGCVDTVIIAVVVPEIPVADFTSNMGCPGTPSAFTDISTVGGASTINTWAWDFGDGNTSTAQNPTNPYAAAGNYNVQLTVTTNDGCTHSVTIAVTVPASTIADFTTANVCDGFAASFTDISVGATAWAWDFGDGNTSTAQNPTHTYAAPGTYNVTLVASAGPCTDNITYPITVYPSPVANFNDAPGCEGAATNFTDASTGATSWSWDFGDGNTSTAQNPSNTYATGGTYNVQLAVMSADGCVDTVIIPVVVPYNPVVGFTGAMGCINTPSTFTDTSFVQGGATLTNWAWDFGDGNTSTAQNPTNTYTVPGVYNVSLTVTSSSGCITNVVIPMTVPPTTVADFTTADVCDGYAASFTDASTGATAWDWDFGDGSPIDNNQNPTHTYAGPGTYTVTLTSYAGVCTDVISYPITVNETPVPDFTSVPACPGTGTAFTDASTVGGGPTITGWAWDFGDGSTSTAQNPTNTYATGGTYAVQLIVTTSTGCVDSITYNVVVPYTPVAEFTMGNVCDGTAGTFTSVSTVTNGTITLDSWDFGDGNTATGSPVNHTYATNGTYTVVLTSTTNDGCVDDTTMTITIYPNPIADFTATAPCEGDLTTLTDNSNPNGGTITTYEWDVDNNGTVDYTGNPASHNFGPAGTYNVSYTVTTLNGCSGNVVLPVTVHPNPVADFTLTNICEGQVANFNDASAVATGAITGWDWDFGDGNTSTAQNPSNTYGTQNVYTVELVATSDQGCTDTMTQTIDVYPIPVADFSPQSVCLNIPVNFMDQSTVDNTNTTNVINQWDWDLGDGTTYTGIQNPPTHVYGTAGNYNISLTVTTDNGCTNSLTVPLSIYEKPVADFTFTDDCVDLPSDFTDLSTVVGSVVNSWKWDFGDGNTSTTQNPTHNYTTAGTYNVELIVTSAFGCTDTIVQPVIRYPMPTASFTAPFECEYDSVQFTNTSTVIAPSTIFSEVWGFGDGSPLVTTQDPAHLYASEGTYAVTLIVTTDHGCVDDTVMNVTVHPQPNVDFTGTNVCINEPPTVFTNQSSVVTGSMASWNWNFGDNTVSPLQDPTHVYGSAGVYNVQLIGISDMGCADTAVHPVEVYEKPIAAFTSDVTEGCDPLDVVFQDQSTHNATSIIAWDWDLGNGTSSADQNPGTQYDGSGTLLDMFYDVTLIVTNDNGCMDTVSVANYITVHPDPIADFRPMPEITDEHNPIIDFDNTSINGESYYWDFGDGDSSALFEPSHFYTDTGVFNVMLVAATQYGCVDTTYANVYIEPVPGIHVPNAFTPDGDGVNDVFLPILHAYDSWQYELYIYDRWGQIIFESFAPHIGWDGTVKGVPASEKTDVFVWQVVLKDTRSGEEKEFIGHVTLLK